MLLDPRYQFDAVDADVILLTSEAGHSTEFRLHRCILAAASPFFGDMFTLPQSKSTPLDKPPTIPVTEPTQLLDTVLRFVYPIPDPALNSLEELSLVLGVAIKYDFTAVIDTLRTQLLAPQYLDKSPIGVYAVACRYDLDDEARVASRQTLSICVADAPAITELRHITGYDYHRLLQLHRQRAQAAVNLLRIPNNVKCMQCNGSLHTMHDSPKWWFEYEKAAKEELAARPSTDVIFGLEFLFRAARFAECSRCPESVLDSWKVLRTLKDAIDALPATV
ncbi:hypothetical protein B0H34DRAFT_649166 [Crassisporium funariophilum]|nr:hypothetical protein B0H34DRAFT_649166 [Crassisporium funariophilum]